MPYMCASQYVLNRDDFASWCSVPRGCEGVIWLTGHTRDQHTQDHVDRWRANGWTVGSLDRQSDHLVFP